MTTVVSFACKFLCSAVFYGDHLVALLQAVAVFLFFLSLLRLGTNEEQPENDDEENDEKQATILLHESRSLFCGLLSSLE